MAVVLPGDQVTDLILSTTTTATSSLEGGNAASAASKVLQGTGLRHDSQTHQISVHLAGRLIQPAQQQQQQQLQSQPSKSKKSNKAANMSNNAWYVQHNSHRYRPMVHDRVLAIVEDRLGPDGNGGDWYRMNLVNGSHPALLSTLEFEGATKRNKPNLVTGMLLYARVVTTTTSGMDPVLSCQLGPRDVGLTRKDWMTNEGTYGELKGGTVCRISLGLARALLHPHNVVLQELAQPHYNLAFEICVGVNGLLWIHSGGSQPEITILVQNAIRNSEVLTLEQTQAMVKSLVDTTTKQKRLFLMQQEQQNNDA